MSTVKYIGLDVHKKSIAIAIADFKRNSEVRYYGQVENEMEQLNKVLVIAPDTNYLRLPFQGPSSQEVSYLV